MSKRLRFFPFKIQRFNLAVPTMQFELWYLIAVPVLFAAGWLSRGLESRQQSERDQLPECYSRGVSLLLGDEPDRAVESFTEAVRLDPETTELQLVLGRLYRRRGDFTRAVRLHRHLCNREDISGSERLEAMRELALDYFTAGLYDRAEATYRHLSETPSTYLEAQKKLLEIYVIEHEWQRAVDTALAIEVRAGENRSAEIAHYYCELAEGALLAKNFGLAQEYVDHAMERGEATPRVDIVAGRVSTALGNRDDALRHWRRVTQRHPEYLPLVLGGIADALDASGDRENALMLLRNALEENQTVDVLEAALTRLSVWENPTAAEEAARTMLSRHPSLSAFNALLQLQAKANPEDEKLKLLSQLMSRHARRFARYRCSHCGFLASSFSWRCLGCGHWDSFPPRRIEDQKS